MGGGIFLGPLLLLAGWADTRQAMGITAAFVLVNSLAGLVVASFLLEILTEEIPAAALPGVRERQDALSSRSHQRHPCAGGDLEICSDFSTEMLVALVLARSPPSRG